MKQEEFEAIHGKLPPNTVYIDLDEGVEPEVKTHGWTDEMILRKSAGELKALILQRETGLAALLRSVDNERVEISKLRDVLQRRRQL
jgi:hypothetical protein